MNPPDQTRDAAGDRFWVRWPGAVRRRWLTLGTILADGSYLRAWPALALTVPLGAGVLGAGLAGLLATLSGGPLYTYSFTVVALLLVVSGLGAGVGVWAWLGFTIVNLAIADRSQLPGFFFYQRGPLDRVLNGWVPLAITYGVLLSLLVLGPLLGRLFGAATERAVRRRSEEWAGPAGSIISVLVLAGYTYSWAQAVPFMIRPLWSFGGSTPEIAAVQPIQAHIGWLTAVAVLAGTARVVLTALAQPRLAGRPISPSALPGPPGPVRISLRLAWVPVQALVITLLLGGLVSSRLAGLLLWVLVSGIGYLRILVVPNLTGWSGAVQRVPLLVRIIGCALVSYVLTSLIVQPAVDRGATSFVTLVIVVLTSLLVAAFVLPGRPLRSEAGR